MSGSADADEDTGTPPDAGDEAGLEEEDEAEKLAKEGDRKDALVEFLAVHSLLIFASIWGVLAREGLIALGTYDGLSVFPTLLAQVVGCWIMGLANHQKEPISRIYGPLFPAVTTGFCGSVTTFSAFMFQVFRAFANTRSLDRHGLHNVVDAFSQTAATIGMSCAAIAFGYQCGTFCDVMRDRRARLLPEKRPIPFPLGSKVRNGVAIFLGLACWIGSAILLGLGPRFWRGRVTYSLVFGPPGTLLRFHLARLNAKPWAERRGFPLGTFLANILGTAIYALAAMLQVSGAGSNGVEACDVLQGVRDGVCGCLTTISTFAFELRKLKTWHAWNYAFWSWTCGQMLCVLLFGVYSWTVHTKPMCKL